MLKLILWPPGAKSWLIGKDPDVGKDWRWEKKGVTENETVGWHHWLSRHEFEQAPGDAEGQGRLACCRPWGHKESDMTYRLNSNNACEGSLLGLLFCPIGLEVTLYAGTTPFWWLLLCSKFWNREVWVLQLLFIFRIILGVLTHFWIDFSILACTWLLLINFLAESLRGVNIFAYFNLNVFILGLPRWSGG